jgi:hypothetical protein
MSIAGITGDESLKWESPPSRKCERSKDVGGRMSHVPDRLFRSYGV